MNTFSLLAAIACFGFSASILAAPLSAKESAVLKAYLKIQEQLAADTLKGVASAAETIRKNSDDPGVQAAAAEIAADKDIVSARRHFRGIAGPMDEWAKRTRPEGINRAHCPMAKASWLQKKGPLRNPYYGKEMLTCGEFIRE